MQEIDSGRWNAANKNNIEIEDMIIRKKGKDFTITLNKLALKNVKVDKSESLKMYGRKWKATNLSANGS